MGCKSDDDSGTNGESIDTEPEGELVSETIGADGGQITSDDGMATLDFPAGALSEDTEVTIQRMTRPDRDDLHTNLYEFGPADVDFDEPVAVNIEYDESEELQHGRVLYLTRVDGGELEYVLGQTTSVGGPGDEGVLEAELAEFSIYGGFLRNLPSDIAEACSRNCNTEEFCIRQEDDQNFQSWYDDYDHCVERCIDAFGDDVSSECLELYGGSMECLEGQPCSTRFDEYGLPAGVCSATLWATVKECSAGHLVPDDPAFIADLSADGPGGDGPPGGDAFLVVVWDLTTDSQFRTGKFENAEVEFEKIVLHDDEGDTIDVELGDVSGDLVVLGPPPDDQVLTVAWNMRIPAGHYTDIETVVNPIEIIDADQDDRTADFSGVPDMHIHDGRNDAPTGMNVREEDALVLRYMPASLDIDGEDVTLGVHQVSGEDEPGVWSITGPWDQTLGFPESFENR